MRFLLLMLALAAIPRPVQAQFRNRANLERLNRRLDGRLLDYTHNHGRDVGVQTPMLHLRPEFRRTLT